MNYEILYAILIGLVFVALAVFYFYIKRKYNIKNEDLLEGVDTLELLISVVIGAAKDMGFGNEEILDKLKYILVDVFEYVRVIIDEDEEIIIATAIAKTEEMCLSLDISLDGNRRFIIETIIVMGYNLYKKIEESK